ncbi:LacI family DNA-binding transcriptional regulator [Allomuricauda sp. SCSIO 65647]|uniref:LacI family DNA-binding transcriptional regulator n=1 Tax=Allomuricauda sp. SCSIO 65647 TaxID=2908843 RepID=UPI001F3014F2|nr:LacI family DNA-binding transcriptional regulator [Muricauda sp. SCSIO 65647]UJH67825.1 LacI family transcriptional regulator [Muricauda sp. SCSIO 65647]
MSKKASTIQSIADELGVSVSTVSRVLNGVGKKYRISEKTIDAVHEMAIKLNYVPNNIAKSLRLKKSSTIGLVIPDISNPWFAKIASKIEKETRNKGYNIFLCNSDDDIEIEKRSLSLLQNWMVDGIIIVPIGLEHEHILKVSKEGTPVVVIDRFFENVDLPYVSTNDFEGAYKATEHLIKNGHRRIACLQGIIGTSSNNQRVGGYIKALSDHGIALDENLIMGSDFGFDNGYTHAKHIIKDISKNKITAIFSTGNQITLGVLKAFKEKKVKIPGQISLVSYDEEAYSELLYTPLSTISHLEDEDLGILALKLLFDEISIISSADTPKGILLPTQLIKRESVLNISKKVQ